VGRRKDVGLQLEEEMNEFRVRAVYKGEGAEMSVGNR
jgi:hypothetical protein